MTYDPQQIAGRAAQSQKNRHVSARAKHVLARSARLLARTADTKPTEAALAAAARARAMLETIRSSKVCVLLLKQVG